MSGVRRSDGEATGEVSLARRWLEKIRAITVRLTSVLVFLGLWQVASIQKWSAPINFQNVPAPTQVAVAAVDFIQSPKVASHIGRSLLRVFIGFCGAAVLAILIGMAVGQLRFADEALMTPLELLRPIPAVAWIPLAILMFPTAETSMIFITFIGAFFPILLGTIHGVQSLDPRLVRAALTLGAGPVSIFREVILPGALPSIVTGLSIGMGTSWFSLVTSEMISGQYGIGYHTWESYTLQNYQHIVLGMSLIGFMGMMSSVFIRSVGHSMMPWFALDRGQTT